MDGHRSGPKASRACLADDAELAGANIFHRAGHRADIAGAARADHDDTEIAQHKLKIQGISKKNPFGSRVKYCLLAIA